MAKPIKSHLCIQDKYLASLLYFKDQENRGCLKLSFKNKIADFVRGTDLPTTLPVPARLDDPMSLDVSYKFQDSLLEVKKLINGKIEREFHKVALPVSNYLFIIRIRDWTQLDESIQPKSPLTLVPPSQHKSVAVVFSFLGENGKPFKPPQYEFPGGMRSIDLPETPLDSFWMGISEDADNNDTNGFNLLIPFPLQ